MEPTNRTSLHAFCRDNQLAKSTVNDRCKSLGIATSNGLSADDCDRLRAEFKVAQRTQLVQPEPVQPEPVQPEPVQQTRPHVDAGNHQIVLAVPTLPACMTLENLRSEQSVTIADPLAVASSFLENADLLIGAMNADVLSRQQQLQQTAAAKQQIEAKAAELRLEQRLYQQNAAAIDQQQTAATTQLADALQVLQAFAKKPDSASSESSL